MKTRLSYTSPHLETVEERDEFMFYLTVGSVNMDYRSQSLNGEVMTVLSGARSLIGIIDFLLLAGLCEWPDTVDEMEELLEPRLRIGRIVIGNDGDAGFG